MGFGHELAEFGKVAVTQAADSVLCTLSFADDVPNPSPIEIVIAALRCFCKKLQYLFHCKVTESRVLLAQDCGNFIDESASRTVLAIDKPVRSVGIRHQHG